jgi:hypothetical protein
MRLLENRLAELEKAYSAACALADCPYLSDESIQKVQSLKELLAREIAAMKTKVSNSGD